MTTWRRAGLVIAAVCDLVAGGVIAWWSISGAFALSLFALLFFAAGALLVAALSRNSTRLTTVPNEKHGMGHVDPHEVPDALLPYVHGLARLNQIDKSGPRPSVHWRVECGDSTSGSPKPMHHLACAVATDRSVPLRVSTARGRSPHHHRARSA